MWDKSKKMPNLCSKIAPASPGVSDKKSPAPGGLGASIPRPRPRSGGGGPGASGGLSPGVGNSIYNPLHKKTFTQILVKVACK